MLAKFDDPEILLPGHAFIAPAVEQRHQVHSGCTGLGIRSSVSQRHLDSPLHLTLHEYVVQHAVLIDVFGIEYGIAAAEAAKLSRVELAKLRLFYR